MRIFKTVRHAILVVALVCTFQFVKAFDFTIVGHDVKACIVYDSKGPALDSITAHLLAEDIERVSGYRPLVLTDISKATGNAILIGNIDAALIQKVFNTPSLFYKQLHGKWEC